MYVARRRGGRRDEAELRGLDERAEGANKPEMRKKLGPLELVESASRGVKRRNEAPLERMSSVGAYDEPRMKGVPRMLNLGVPILHEGIATSNNGGCCRSISSTVLGRCSSPGWVMTTLNAPGSDSRAMLVSGSVESDKARRWR